ncbi:hypothetical protein HBH98_207840 [Parastagonospora nodorum]|nr:hypothetical protein HBH53_105950 [Parastagonospora nodorum]KAH4339362.1 hypothetical protein HBH98_207840 [Parastagonospora nodorum]KAH4361940.1 hypothetical protein HBH97_195130 [Parastagonospora nodorum]KAH4377127.1 hypothetical protein HBH99_207280 [Parastagonospora nodorum]KAH4911586.1 hypothetical protein HBI80_025260 [Parastagonospora nodorum]
MLPIIPHTHNGAWNGLLDRALSGDFRTYTNWRCFLFQALLGLRHTTCVVNTVLLCCRHHHLQGIFSDSQGTEHHPGRHQQSPRYIEATHCATNRSVGHAGHLSAARKIHPLCSKPTPLCVSRC